MHAAVQPVLAAPTPPPVPVPSALPHAASTVPLAPAEENARIQTTLAATGKPHGDSSDRDAYDLSHRVVDDAAQTLHAKEGEIQLASFECFSGGCVATLKVASAVDSKAFERRFQGYSYGAPSVTWPGGRVFPPGVVNEDKSRLYSVVFVRSDTPAIF